MTLLPPPDDERIAAAVRKVVGAAPPLNGDQAAHLRAAGLPVRPGRRHTSNDDHELGEAA